MGEKPTDQKGIFFGYNSRKALGYCYLLVSNRWRKDRFCRQPAVDKSCCHCRFQLTPYCVSEVFQQKEYKQYLKNTNIISDQVRLHKFKEQIFLKVSLEAISTDLQIFNNLTKL